MEKSDTGESKLISPRDIAALTNTSPQSWCNWVRQGRISAVRVGKRKIMIPISEVERMLSSESTGVRLVKGAQLSTPVSPAKQQEVNL